MENQTVKIGEFHKFNGKLVKIEELELHNMCYVLEVESHPTSPTSYRVNINDLDLLD